MIAFSLGGSWPQRNREGRHDPGKAVLELQCMSHVLFPEPDCEHVDGSFIIVESQCYKIYSLEFKKYFIFF